MKTVEPQYVFTWPKSTMKTPKEYLKSTFEVYIKDTNRRK